MIGEQTQWHGMYSRQNVTDRSYVRIHSGFAGTPGYLSPEVLKKEPYGKPVDIWACGKSSIESDGMFTENDISIFVRGDSLHSSRWLSSILG